MPKVNKPKNTDIQEQLAQKLQTLRKQKGVSQSEIAKYIDLSVGAYQNYENGRREANYETLIKFANYFNVSTDYLLGRTVVKQTATEQPDPFANIDVSALEKRIIKKYTELDETARALSIELFRQISTVFTTEQEEQKLSNPPIIQSNPPIQQQPVQPPVVQSSPQSQLQQPNSQRQMPVQQPVSTEPSPQSQIQIDPKKPWRLTARRTDGRYESRLATPEELEKLRLALEDSENGPKPEY